MVDVSKEDHTIVDTKMIHAQLDKKYISDFGLVKINNGTRKVLKNRALSIKALAEAHGCEILGFVNENKRHGEYTDPMRGTLRDSNIVFIGTSTRYTHLEPCLLLQSINKTT